MARTKRWWLLPAEFIRWPRISFFAHFSGCGRSDVSALFIFASNGFAWATVRPRSLAAVVNGLLKAQLLPLLIANSFGLIVLANLIRPRRGETFGGPLPRAV